jgi:CubicO group peptidase (beta-lactamase class C family)
VNLAGAALAYISQQPFERIIERDITGPLGMTRTTFRDPYPARPDLPAPMPAALAAEVADGFYWSGAGWRKRPYEYTSQGAPAGGASTTAADMARYMTMILNGGTLDGAVLYGRRSGVPIPASPGRRMASCPSPCRAAGRAGATTAPCCRSGPR